MTEHEHHDHNHDHDHHDHVVSYPDAVAQFRAQKDTYYKSGLHSPIPIDERDTFAGLPYYPVDEGLVFEERRLEPYTGDEPSDFQIPTSDGKMRPAHRAGYLSFELGRATTADGLHVRRRRGRGLPVRSVRRRDERQRDLWRRALPRPRTRG